MIPEEDEEEEAEDPQMAPDSEYVSLIMYTTKLEVVNDYYDKHPTEVMSRLEHQTTDIMNEMYDSVTNDNFDSISDYTDRVSAAVYNDTGRNDKDEMPYDNDKDEMPYDSDDTQMPYEYDNDNDTTITEVKNDRNMTNDDLKYVGTNKRCGTMYKR